MLGIDTYGDGSMIVLTCTRKTIARNTKLVCAADCSKRSPVPQLSSSRSLDIKSSRITHRRLRSLPCVTRDFPQLRRENIRHSIGSQRLTDQRRRITRQSRIQCNGGGTAIDQRAKRFIEFVAQCPAFDLQCIQCHLRRHRSCISHARAAYLVRAQASALLTNVCSHGKSDILVR